MPDTEMTMLILADDYTGAADAAAGMAAHGFSAAILLDPDAEQAGVEVIALDLDTRHRPPEEAADRVTRALTGRNEDSLIFKKIDSTLRGRIEAELGAIAQSVSGSPAPLLIAPAVPENGRIVRDGTVWVRGIPLAETDVWRHDRATFDPDTPARLSERLTRACLPTAEIHLSALRQGSAGLTATLRELHRNGIGAVVLDAETANDLELIADAAVSLPAMPVCVGAAGFSRALGHVLKPRAPATPPVRTTPATPVLLAIASQAGSARAQVEVLKIRSDLTAIAVSGFNDAILQTVQDTLAAERHVLLFVPPAGSGGLSRDYAAAMGRIVAQGCNRAGALIASGGDTARACLLALGHTRIAVERELAPGIVLGHPCDRPALAFVSKAGDFGDAETLSTCIDLLSSPSRGAAS